MIAADRNRSFQIAAPHEFIDRFAHLSAFAVAEPADARGQALELHAIARKAQPAIQGFVVGKKLKRKVVCLPNVFGLARKSDPAEWTLTCTKQRTNVLRHETGNFECILAAGIEG